MKKRTRKLITEAVGMLAFGMMWALIFIAFLMK